MLHHESKEGDRIIMRRGGETFYFFVRRINRDKRRALISISTPEDWKVEFSIGSAEELEDLERRAQHG